MNAFFLALPFPLSLLAIPAVRGVVAAFVVLAAVWGFVAYREHAAYKRGVTDMKTAVETQNGIAAEAASKARLSVNQCFDAGREWDQARGVCGE